MQAWCPPGTRPIIGQQIVREYVYAYAAVAPELGKMTALVLPYANTKMMNLFLEQVSIEFQDYFLIIQLDGAAWHSSKDLVIPENIRLITQPAHSPELNPVEHLWESIRAHHFYNQVFDSIDAVMDKLCQGLNELISAPEKLRSMTYFPHLRIAF
jgi:transposase